MKGILAGRQRTEASKQASSSSNTAKAATDATNASEQQASPVPKERQERDPSPSSVRQLQDASPGELQDRMAQLMEERQWDQVERLCEQHPYLARATINMVCQGENCTCLPIHYASGQKTTPVSTIDALVTVHPSSLLTQESSAGRLPLHLAVLKGAPFAVVRYLCEAQARSLSQEDEEGNLPLHYASMYCNDAIIELLVKAYPQACSHSNKSDRLPLHLLCARCWDSNVISVETLKLLVEENSSALEKADRRGRMPLHVACSSSDPRADVLNVLVPLYPQALLSTDKSKLTPLEMARKFSPNHHDDNNVVLAFLQDRTNRERRKKYKFLAPFKHVSYKMTGKGLSARRGKPDIDALNLHYCYG